MTYQDYSDVTKTRPEKSLVHTRKKTGGRNMYGRVTARAIGGGHKQKVRNVDFRRNKFGIDAKVIAVEYDPMRSARLALIEFVGQGASVHHLPRWSESGRYGAQWCGCGSDGWQCPASFGHSRGSYGSQH
jgi:large subunit ribosomal protein L2